MSDTESGSETRIHTKRITKERHDISWGTRMTEEKGKKGNPEPNL